MATVGNNSSLEFANFRDAFLRDGDELSSVGKHIQKEIEISREENSPIEGISSLGPRVYLILKSSIMSSKYQSVEKFKALDLLKKLMSAEHSADNIFTLLMADNKSKVIICEIINNCVEFGLFHQGEMQHIENEMGLLLHSIEDYQSCMEKEI